MKRTMIKLSAALTTLTSFMYPGGDIAPIESSVEPAVAANSGDAMSITTMLVLMGLTILVGLFFRKKESL